MPGRAVLWLAFSSLLGIVIADTLWLAALQILGARRMIAIDALKPFVAAFMGYFLLGDAVPWLGYVGVVVCALGVYLLNVESAEQEQDAVAGDARSSPEAAGNGGCMWRQMAAAAGGDRWRLLSGGADGSALPTIARNSEDVPLVAMHPQKLE